MRVAQVTWKRVVGYILAASQSRSAMNRSASMYCPSATLARCDVCRIVETDSSHARAHGPKTSNSSTEIFFLLPLKQIVIYLPTRGARATAATGRSGEGRTCSGAFTDERARHISENVAGMSLGVPLRAVDQEGHWTRQIGAPIRGPRGRHSCVRFKREDADTRASHEAGSPP